LPPPEFSRPEVAAELARAMKIDTESDFEI